MPHLSTKERKAKFNTNDLIFRKKTLIYLLEHYYLYQAMLIWSAAPLNTTLLNQ